MAIRSSPSGSSVSRCQTIAGARPLDQPQRLGHVAIAIGAGEDDDRALHARLWPPPARSGNSRSPCWRAACGTSPRSRSSLTPSSRSSSISLPARTSLTPAKPSPSSAWWIALPCGIEHAVLQGDVDAGLHGCSFAGRPMPPVASRQAFTPLYLFMRAFAVTSRKGDCHAGSRIESASSACSPSAAICWAGRDPHGQVQLGPVHVLPVRHRLRLPHQGLSRFGRGLTGLRRLGLPRSALSCNHAG